MIRIFRGDDVSFNRFDRRVCVYLNSYDDLTGWSASFELFDNVKTFPDISAGAFSFGYSAEETQCFPLGLTYAKLTIMDANGKTRVCKKVEVDIQNRIPVQDCGSVSVAVDVVFSDYSQMGNIPTLNGKKILGDHDSAYYGLAGQEAIDSVAAVGAMNAADIQTLKEKVTRNTAANADQGVAIAQNAQSITGLRNDLKSLSSDFRATSAETKDRLDSLDRRLAREQEERRAGDDAVRTFAREAATSAENKANEAKRSVEDLETSVRGQITSLTREIQNEASLRRTDYEALVETVSTAKSVMQNGIAANEQKVSAVEARLDSSVKRLDDKTAALRNDLIERIDNEATVRAEDDRRVKKDFDALRSQVQTEIDDAKRSLSDSIALVQSKSDDIDRRMGASLAAEIKSREFTDTALTSECAARATADRELLSKIKAEGDARADGDAETLAAAKAYTDAKTTAAIRYKGAVNTLLDLDNIAEKEVGDMYNVKDTGANYVWSGGAGADYNGWDKQSEDIDLSPLEERIAANAVRISAVERKSDANESAIAAEQSARADGDAAERAHADSIVAEAKQSFSEGLNALSQRTTANENAIAAEVSDRTSADNALEAKIAAEKTGRDAEVSRLDAADASLRADLAAEVSNRETAVADASSALDAKIAAAKEAALAAVSTEETARREADASLTAKISTETAARERAVELEKNAREIAVAEEKSARENAVANEATARRDADAQLDTRITNEISARQTAVADEATLREQNDAIVYQKITVASEQSIARDTALRQDLSNEATRRAEEDARIEADSKSRDNALTASLSEEKSARENAVAEEAETRTSEDARILQEAKDYADASAAKAMHYKGTVTDRNALEAIENPATGDFYNVLSYQTDEQDEQGEYIVVKGANFAWNGAAWDKLSETIDLSPLVAADEALAARVAAVESKSAANEGAIAALSTETIPALGARIDENAAAIAANKTASDEAVAGVSASVSSAVSRVSALEATVDGTPESKGLVERTAALETSLATTKAWLGDPQTGKEDITSRLTTAESVISFVRADVASVKTDLSDTKVSIASRISGVEGQVSTEHTRANAAEQALSTRIDTLASSLADAKTDMAEDLAQTKEELDAKIAAATSPFAAKDAELESRIASAETDISAETTRAKTAEAELSQKVAAENSRAVSKENSLSVAITSEHNRAVARENEIEGKIPLAVEAEATTRAAEDVRILTEAKSYADARTAGAMVYRGKVADLAALNAVPNPANGDIYFVDGEAAYYAYSADAAQWNEQSGMVDLSEYAKTADMASADNALDARCAALESRVASLEAVLASLFGSATVTQPVSITLYGEDGQPYAISVTREPNEETGIEEPTIQITE